MKIAEVISGGQAGADQAGWRAAKGLGILTRGLMPAGFRTEGILRPDGRLGPDEDHPEFAELFGATQHHSRDYPPRTRENVRAADVTLIFNLDRGRGFSSGTAQAVGAARRLGREFVVLDLEPHHADFRPRHLHRVEGGEIRRWQAGTPAEVRDRLADFLDRRDARVLNVAGSRESNAPGVGAWVEAFVAGLLRA